MNGHPTAQPQISLLSPEQIEQIHQYVLRLLAATGVRVDEPQARDLLAKAGASVVDGDRVRIPAELVDWAVERAPSRIPIYDRRGNPAFTLGEGPTRFGIGVTTLFYQDPLTDEVIPFARRHMQEIVRLGGALPNFDVISTPGIIQDVPEGASDLYEALEMSANTTKPLVILTSTDERFPDVLDLLETLHGDLGRRPFVLPYFNPVTPLILNRGTVNKMRAAIDRGLPFIFSNYSMAGATTPITPAGTLVVLMAELLAGLVLSQLMKEGASILLGILPAYFDMKTMVNFYEPQSMLMNLACAEMMAHYGLPHCGTSGSGTGWGPDLLSAETYWMNQLVSCTSQVSLAPFVGDTLASKAFSPSNMVYVHEVIEQARRFARGLNLDEAEVGFAEIDKTGPGGNFIATKTTRGRYRTAYYTSPVFPRLSFEKWQAEGRPQAVDYLRRHTRELIESAEPPEDYEALIQRGERWIKNKR